MLRITLDLIYLQNLKVLFKEICLSIERIKCGKK